MRTSLCICAALLSGHVLQADVTLNPNPSRVIGQNSVASGSAPNLVEGREFNSPQSLVLDTTASPPILYVSDTGNNRVLAWQDATKAGAGVAADLVIGQRDKFSTTPWVPGTGFNSGLRAPTGLAVDAQGNLYVVDSGNNRTLRFPRPFDHIEDLQIPDLVIGQKSLDTNAPNTGGVSASTIAVNVGGSVYRASLLFDTSGNLYFTDAGNNRVLRYPASVLGPGAANGPAASLVLGQPDFATNTALPRTTQSLVVKTGLNAPGGMALDQRVNRLFVSDALGRVLVYPLPLQTGMGASRIMGVLIVASGQPAPPAVNETAFNDPEGILILGNNPAVFDALNNRIVIFDPVDQWPAEGTRFSPQAKWVIGQPDLFTGKANAGGKGLSAPVQGVFFNSELYVADAANHRVSVLPQQSASPPVFGSAARVAGQLNFDGNSVNLIEGKELYLNHPSLGGRGGLAIDQKSDPPRLYIADSFNNRILGYRDARRIKTGATADLVIGQPDLFRGLVNYPYNDSSQITDAGLFLPTGLALDANGNLFVADTGNGRVLRFPSPFNQSGAQRPNLVLGQSSFYIKVTDASARTMSAPYGVAITPEGYLLVSDAVHHRVLLFTRPSGGDFTNGQAASAHFGQPDFTSTIQGTGTPVPPNRMNGPRGIAVDSSARLHVCDVGNSRVLIYDAASSKGPTDDPTPAVALSGLRNPYGVEVSQATGEIWVTDTFNTSNPRVVRYRSFEQLPVDNYLPTASVRANAPLAAALDPFGNLFVAEAANRVAVYYPAMVPVNAANYVASSTRPLSPGVIATLYPSGGKLAPEEKTFTDLPNPIPVPKTLGDVQLLFNDTPAPLYYVGPSQINFLVPMNAPSSGIADLVLQRASTGQVLAAGLMQMGAASPALFTANASGSGQVAALNQDNSVNSPANAAARGEVIQLFGTGQGFVSGAPPDGELASGLVPTSEKPAVWIEGSTDDRGGYVPPDFIQYSGLAPSLVGVWQINVKIPEKTAPGSRIIYVMLKSIASSPPQTRISVK